jgi:hypothetical protein
MRNGSALALALTAALALPGCSSDDVTLPPNVNVSILAVSIDPNPVTVTVGGDGSLNLGYRVIMQEVSGLGGEVLFINASVFDEPSGQLVRANNFDSRDLLVFFGSKRIEGGGTMEVPQQIAFGLPLESTGARLVVTVQFRDDRGNVLHSGLLSTVAFPTPPAEPAP